MTVINGLGSVAGARTPAKGRAASGFRVAQDQSGGRAEGPVAAGGVFMPSLLAMQEAESGAVWDREARRHGETILEALAALQRALLGGGSRAELAELAGLARNMPKAADPRLAGVQRALLVRVAVELARRRAAER